MTPMFKQFHELKAKQPDAILFFRMGDFYEVFYDDAELCSRVLDITLTARNKTGDPIPMAGVPHHAAAGYVQRLTDEGYRVAIAEQVEDPALAKGLVRRDIVRVVTPGIVLNPTNLASREPNHIVAVADNGESIGVAFLDISTGDLRCTQVEGVAAAIAEVHRMEPKEALISPGLQNNKPLAKALARHGTLISRVEDEAWTQIEATGELRELLGVRSLSGFGVTDDQIAVHAAGALARYGRQMSGERVGNIHALRYYEPLGFMVIDDTTRRNLEIHRTMLGGHRKGTLLWLLDKTGTAMGSRLLKEWLAFPLLDVAKIRSRQRAVAALVEDAVARDDLRSALKQIADIERIGARITQSTANARDLAALGRSLSAAPDAVSSVAGIADLVPRLPRDTCIDLAEELGAWLVDDPPVSLTEGGLLRRGVHDELDELISMSLEGVGYIDRMEGRERHDTGIGSLKIRKNKVFGYYIEVTRAHLHKVPEHYVRKQTLSNCERYITPELKELEEKVLGADERRKSLEYQ
ncbi:MAG: DNA mismatch repair protein MutS, partial [Kiritimatiellia bacterium]